MPKRPPASTDLRSLLHRRVSVVMAATAPHAERRTIVAESGSSLPIDLTGVRWRDGTAECRARLEHPTGSLVAADGDVGEVLTSADAACDTCSDACAPCIYYTVT